jgi:transposase
MGWTHRAPAPPSRKASGGQPAAGASHVTQVTNLEAVATIGIDIGKNTFHLIGLDKKGAIVLRQKLSRGQVDTRLANMPPCRRA